MNALTEQIIGAAMKVHSELGPGLLESAYQACLDFEMRKRGLRVIGQLELPVVYSGVRIDAGYRMDFLIEDQVVVELKTVERVLPVHRAQLLSYLKLSQKRVGLLINFHVERLRDGIVRMMN